MTQRDLSVATGIDQPNVSAIETGRRMPSAETLHRLLGACGFEVVAAAGEITIALPPPHDDLFDGERGDMAVGVAGPLPDDLPMATRARMVVAVLDAAEAIVRSR